MNHDKKKVVIIGGGVIGVTTSYYLSKEGYQVTCLEKNSNLSNQSSYKNGALLCPSLYQPWSSYTIWGTVFTGFKNKITNVLTINKINNPSPISFTKNSLLDLSFWQFIPRFIGNANYVSTKKNAESISFLGKYSMECFTHLLKEEKELSFDMTSKGTISLQNNEIPNNEKQNQLVELEPDIKNSANLSKLSNFILDKRDTNGDIFKFTNQLAYISTKKYGTVFETNKEVTNFGIEDNKIIYVETLDGEKYYTDNIIVCTGVNTNYILSKLNIYVPIYPVKGFVVSATMNKALNHNIVDNSKKIFMTSMTDKNNINHLRLSGFAIFDGYNINAEHISNSKYHIYLLDQFQKWFPDIKLNNIELTSCLRPVSPDDKPLIGKLSPYSNLWINAGHGSKGWTQSCGASTLLTRMLIKYRDCTTIRDNEIDSFNPNRF